MSEVFGQIGGEVPAYACSFLRTMVALAHHFDLTEGALQIPETPELPAEPMRPGNAKFTIDKRDMTLCTCLKCGHGAVISYIDFFTPAGPRFTTKGECYCENCTFGGQLVEQQRSS